MPVYVNLNRRIPGPDGSTTDIRMSGRMKYRKAMALLEPGYVYTKKPRRPKRSIVGPDSDIAIFKGLLIIGCVGLLGIAAYALWIGYQQEIAKRPMVPIIQEVTPR